MSLWDGFASENECRVVVVGATNRRAVCGLLLYSLADQCRQDVDRAILRRLPLTCRIDLPVAYVLMVSGLTTVVG